MFLNALPKTEAECPPGTNIYDDSCVLEGSGFIFDTGPCPPGTMTVDGVCVGVGSPEEFLKRQTTKNQGISPALILAAAAAFFFAG